MQTVSVLGSRLAALDYAQAVEVVRNWACLKDKAYTVAAANTHVTALARRDPVFGAALQSFDLILPDGMPLVWVMNRVGKAGLRDRVYGPNFMLRTLELNGPSHFFLGGTPELLAKLQEKLSLRFPGLRVAGTYAPSFGEWDQHETARILGAIKESSADFVWIGLGCPKQELWLAKMKKDLPPAVYVGVGAAFAFHAGRVRQAPLWMQRCGLEWFFRLCMEPRRLWKRFVVYNSLFIFYVLKEQLFRR